MPGRKPAVLVVSDDDDVARSLERMLDGTIDSITVVASADEASTTLGMHEFGLVIADFARGRLAPYDVLSGIRRASDVSILALAAAHGEPTARCLELGADDCVSWPVGTRELCARVRLRGRTSTGGTSALVFGDLAIDTQHRSVATRDAEVHLTDREFDLLVYLARTPGHPVTASQLLEAVWHSQTDWQTTRTVAEHVYRLRRKLERDPASPERILTVRGRGYCFSG